MKEVTLHIENGHPVDIHINNQPDRPVEAFLLIAIVPADPPGAVLLNYGNSSSTGNMLMTLYQRSVHEHPELAWVLEQVSRGIITFADAERKRWPAHDLAGRA
jgi:hypothetical protein